MVGASAANRSIRSPSAAVFDVHEAHPDLPIVGVGGVTDGWNAVELMLAGASAVQVGTANFVSPASPCCRYFARSPSGVAAVACNRSAELVGAAH